MSDSAASKKVAIRMFDLFSQGDIAGVVDLLTDDAVWWLAGKPDGMPGAGNRSKTQIARMFQHMSAALEGPIEMTVKNAIAEGDQVALEVESLGHLRNGRTYKQEYHFRVTVRGDRISAVREYLDTLHAKEVWGTP